MPLKNSKTSKRNLVNVIAKQHRYLAIFKSYKPYFVTKIIEMFAIERFHPRVYWNKRIKVFM